MVASRTMGSAPSSSDWSVVSYSRWHTRLISLMYFFVWFPHALVSRMGAVTFPRSVTSNQRVSICSRRPAIRIAEGPMSIPQQPAPKSNGTPMMWMGFVFIPL